MPNPMPPRPALRRLRPWLGLLSLPLLAALASCGGGASSTGDKPPTGDQATALVASAPGALTSYVQERLRRRAADTSTDASVNPVPVNGAPTASAGSTPRSGTLLQEAGVDEPDLLQTDGRRLYALATSSNLFRLQARARATDGSLGAVQRLDLPVDGAAGLGQAGMVMAPDEASMALLAQAWHPLEGGPVCVDPCPLGVPFWKPGWQRSTVEVRRVDLASSTAPVGGERISLDGRLVDSRRVGNALIVVSTHTPRLEVDELPATATAAEREAAIARLRAADLLPRVRRNGGASAPLLAETDCWVQPANASNAITITTITVFDLASPTLAQRSRCFVGGSEALYMTADSLYLGTTRWTYRMPVGDVMNAWVYPTDIRTDLHKFSLAGGTVNYRASGEVKGHLGWNPEMKSFRLSEWNGDLRVITYIQPMGWASTDDAMSGTTPSPAQLTVLRERTSDQTLQPLATLPNATRPEPLGKAGEQLFAVRFVGTRGYAVTFRTIDPLYVIDLADPADPRITGALEVPGFSNHLYPMDGGLLLGVGRDIAADGRVGGVQVSLFDVADPTRPTLLRSVALGASGSSSALDFSRHGLNWLRQGEVYRVALPVALATADGAGPWQRGLQRFEVDVAARTLQTRALLGTLDVLPWSVALDERSVQIGAQVYHLRDDTLQGYDW